MLSLLPSQAPRSVPLTARPPPARASRIGLWLVVVAWALLASALALGDELGDAFAHPEQWRGVARRVLLGAAGVAVVGGLVASSWGFTRARVAATVALGLGAVWVAFVARSLLVG